jgi:uncharacterized protein (TIGR03437 family)
VSQRRFRFAIVLIAANGTEPSAAELAHVDRYRSEFEQYFARATGGRASADTSLTKSLRLSLFPAAGAVQGRPVEATLTLERPAPADLSIALTATSGAVSLPSAVRIPAGSTTAAFTITPLRAGVDEVRAEPADRAYDMALAKVQVNPASAVRVVAVSGDRQTAAAGAALQQPVVVRVTDENNLPYPGVRLLISTSAGGSISPLVPVTDADGRALIRWTPGTGASSELYITLDGVNQSPSLVVTASRPGAIALSTIVNAASFDPAISPGAIATAYGAGFSTGGAAAANFPWPDSLNGVQVLVNGLAAPVLYVSDGQVNFMVPSNIPEGDAQVSIVTAAGTSPILRISIRIAAPGIFFDPVNGHGAILHAGTQQGTLLRPAIAGDVVEIYCTGLGAVRESRPGLRETVMQPDVLIGDQRAEVLYSGLAAGYLGLYQVNVRVPAGVRPGLQPVSIAINSVRSNAPGIAVR